VGVFFNMGFKKLPSKAEMKHLNKLASIIRSKGDIEKDILIIMSGVSIAWAEKLCKYIPILFKDIEYNKTSRKYNTLSLL